MANDYKKIQELVSVIRKQEWIDQQKRKLTNMQEQLQKIWMPKDTEIYNAEIELDRLIDRYADEYEPLEKKQIEIMEYFEKLFTTDKPEEK